MNRLVSALLDTEGPPLYTTPDIIHAVGGGSADARYALVKRAMASGDLIRIKRGLYTLAPQYRKLPLNIFTVSQMIDGSSYISLESALSLHGWIPEGVRSITAVTNKNSYEYHTPLGHFVYIRVPQRLHFAAVERIVEPGGSVWLLATPLKALADYVYVYRKEWESVEPLHESLRIDYKELSVLTSDDFAAVEAAYTNQRVLRFLRKIRLELCGEC